MDKRTYRRMLKKAKIQTRMPKAGEADWPKIIAKAIKDGGVYTTRQFWTRLVEEKVNIGRTKAKLHELCDKDKKVARIFTKGVGYIWCFDPQIVKEYFKRLKEIKVKEG